MIVVIDTNCLLASIPPKSTHYWLYTAFKNQLFDWLISNEIMVEYEEKLTDRYSAQTANLVLSY
jgi:predicted nucleic acid-binding protein